MSFITLMIDENLIISPHDVICTNLKQEIHKIVDKHNAKNTDMDKKFEEYFQQLNIPEEIPENLKLLNNSIFKCQCKLDPSLFMPLYKILQGNYDKDVQFLALNLIDQILLLNSPVYNSFFITIEWMQIFLIYFPSVYSIKILRHFLDNPSELSNILIDQCFPSIISKLNNLSDEDYCIINFCRKIYHCCEGDFAQRDSNIIENLIQILYQAMNDYYDNLFNSALEWLEEFIIKYPVIINDIKELYPLMCEHTDVEDYTSRTSLLHFFTTIARYLGNYSFLNDPHIINFINQSILYELEDETPDFLLLLLELPELELFLVDEKCLVSVVSSITDPESHWKMEEKIMIHAYIIKSVILKNSMDFAIKLINENYLYEVHDILLAIPTRFMILFAQFIILVNQIYEANQIQYIEDFITSVEIRNYIDYCLDSDLNTENKAYIDHNLSFINNYDVVN